ncbi:mpv17 protein [Chrysochromulina tobinii]|uniref:Mpv17 protein n=1 Tax=Chrysochromulina tobinii TaxID=1460289 RepID=A0A0M0J3Y2_9EUKA|nr:mpv17 protein [Chrysochromulina tobinii]|eukprot:KOO21284.1 mpv17 protein [Chrysochromulina sp. CCMP291]
MMASNPLLTSALTGSMLWSSGDLVAQFLEVKGAGTHEQHIGGSHASEDDFGTGVPIIAADSPKTFDPKRTAGTVVHGAAVGGVGTYLWYNFLDGVVRGAMRLTPGGLPFVGAKLGLEIAIWHPTSLLAYWTICGTAQGHSFEKILRELRDSFVSTLVGDAIFWTPVDILCFWKVPVGLQTLFANAGCFVESIALSYVHDHEPPSAAVAKFAGVSSLARSFASFGSRVDAVVAGASSQFDALDQDRNGRLTLKELQAAQGSLPGVQDQVVGAVMMRLISRRLLATKPNRGEGAAAELYMSKTEYLRMLDALHTTGYRKSRLADVVFAMFDENEDGQIDVRELRNLLCVVTGKEPKGKLVEDILKAADTDTNRKLSKAEFFALMQQMQLSVRL